MKIDNITKIGKPKNKADKFFKDFKKVIYKITGPYGYRHNINDLLEVYLINQEGIHGLLYHPSNNYGSGCFSLARYDSTEKVWKDVDQKSFVNYSNFGLVK